MASQTRLTAVILLTLLIVATFALIVSAAPQADNVILFIGDGMGPNHPVMASEAIGRPLVMQRAPFSGTVVTTSLGGSVTDSAAASTAMATGHKTHNGMISVSPEGQSFETVLEVCRKHGKAVGLATTDSLWAATPAGFYAHAISRGESENIASQLVNSQATVVLGFGRSALLPEAAGGRRKDGQDLVAALRNDGYEIVSNRYELLTAQGQRLVGLFDGGPQAPRVRDMVTAALVRVGASPNGFLLVVEHSHMDGEPGDPAGNFADLLELDEAVAAAVDFANARGRTLVLVTGDHETGGLHIKQPERLPMLTKVNGSAREIAAALNADRSNIAEVIAKFTGLTDLSAAELDQFKQAQDARIAIGDVLSARAGVEWVGRGHTATPVAVFPFGAGAERFAGQIDNTDIAKGIVDVLGVEPFSESASAAAVAVVGASK
jgi:alkaline phosphatase